LMWVSGMNLKKQLAFFREKNFIYGLWKYDSKIL
jgi:hypothetical protein